MPKQPQNAVKINFSATDPRHFILSNYLRASNGITSKMMEATNAYWYSIALAEDPSSSEEKIRLALSESLIALNAHMMMLLEYHKITRQIEPSPNLIARLGITSGAISTQTPIAIHSPLDVAPPSNQPQKNTVAVEDLEDNEDEDDDDDEDGEPKFITPQSVTDFSSFMSK